MGLRVAVIGSRDAGAEAIREMLRTPVAGFVPVAVFDDDGHSHGLSLIGVPVVGGIDDIPAAAHRYTIQQVLLAIPEPRARTGRTGTAGFGCGRGLDEDPPFGA